ncbi:glycosyltransferase family 61 protein [Methylobacterium symbioticum]|uniref:Glycosyltransferase 61 catalytic domain-containing protein n=2 Tax=Methylobacterium TaxID=407 RepID=A0A509EKG8_9HYPH|nr:glycosyltransferase family 61 protein [Methylobacterium symbioticum]VUD74104.1 hypothetical protein MET9862_04729 [Methylobacterium symbioticum]
MRYFYRALWSQYNPAEYWHRVSSAQESWRASLVDLLADHFPVVFVDSTQETGELIGRVAIDKESKFSFVDASKIHDTTAGPCGLVYMTDPADVLAVFDKTCQALQPEAAIFRVYPPRAEKIDLVSQWTELFSRLSALGYSVLDPCGEDFSVEDQYLHSSTFYAIALKRGAHHPDLASVTANYIDQLAFDVTRTVVAPEFLHQSAEVVSLRTAALASGGSYQAARSPNGIFEINQRKVVSSDSAIELARFGSALVLPKPGWKVFADNRYYVEEIGPSDWSGLYKISHWRSLDGFWGINDSSPVIERRDIPEGSFLLGGDPAYYHWIFNFLPRLKAAELLPHMRQSTDPLPILVPDIMPDRLLGFISKLAKFPFTLIRLSDQAIYKIKNLYVPSYYSSHEACLDVSQFYKERLNLSGTKGFRKIYISRSDARDASTPRRKVHNEAEVIDFLERYGFEPVALGDASPDDQIRIFSEASFVIGSHGAAFANMVFSPPGTRAIIFENSWNHTFMKDVLIANLIEANTLLCQDVFDEAYEGAAISRGESADEIRRSRDMIVDLNSLRTMLSEGV